LLFASDTLDFAAMRMLWCPGFQVDPGAVDASRYRGFLSRIDSAHFGPTGFHDYTWAPHIYRDRSTAGDDGRISGARFETNPQILTDGGFALFNGSVYWNQWPTYCGGIPHGLAGINFAFVDGRVNWMPFAKLVENCAAYHYAPNLTRHAPWLWDRSRF
jgi:prepilin-type processing-associated H-X9-DG protein